MRRELTTMLLIAGLAATILDIGLLSTGLEGSEAEAAPKTPRPTFTPRPGKAPSPTATPGPTSTAAPTNTPLPTAVSTATTAPTSTPNATPTSEPTIALTATNTPVATLTDTPVVVPTDTPTPVPTATDTPVPSPTPTNTAMPSPTPTTVPTTTTGSMSAPTGYSSLIFDDQFAGTSLDSSKWIPQIADQNGIWNDNGKLPYPLSAVGNDGNYNAEYGDPSHVVVSNGLSLIGQSGASSYPSLYSWVSGYICTHGKFTFSSGYVQVKAKMPDSRSGGWAGLWFLEGGGEIDLQESGYTGLGVDPNRVMATKVHTAHNQQILYDTGVDLSADYHIYGMEYKPGQSITMYFDGKQVAQYTTDIPKGSFTVIVTNTMAQNASGWHTVVGNTTPSPLTMSVAEVQVWR